MGIIFIYILFVLYYFKINIFKHIIFIIIL